MDDVDDIEDFSGADGELAQMLTPLQWGTLCMDLVLEPDKAEAVCAAHGTTAAVVLDLLASNPQFRSAMREARDRVKSLGPNAGFVLRSQALAENYLTEMNRIVRDRTVSAQTRLRAIENVVRYGRLDPSTDKTSKAGPDGATGVAVTFNFGAALSHLLSGAPGAAAPLTIEAEPTRTE